MSEDEVNMLRHVGSILNGQLNDAVDDINDADIVYVDSTAKFENHNLCRGSSYITHINFTVENGHYHPNESGQDAFSVLMKDFLS